MARTVKMVDNSTDKMEASTDSDKHEVSSSEDDGNKKSDGSAVNRGKKRTNTSISDEDKKAERRAANRRSAFQSRQRRKILIEDLQRTVAALSKDNTDLRKSNEELRVQLEATMLENHQFRMQQQLSGAQGAGILGASLQSAQAQASALLRAGGGQAALSQLLASGAPTGAGAAGAPGAVGENDPLLNARLALAAAQNRVGDLGQSQAAQVTSSAAGQSPGIQGMLDAASVAGAGALGSQLAGLQSMLDSAARVGAASNQFNGLQSFLETASRVGARPQAAGTQVKSLQGLLESQQAGGLSDIQRALLTAPGARNAASNVSSLADLSKKGQGQDGNSTISDALRNLLQQSQVT